jgi:hypothetical protein
MLDIAHEETTFAAIASFATDLDVITTSSLAGGDNDFLVKKLL